MPDPEGARFYANVDNRLEIVAPDGSTFDVALAVPTAWFTLARDHLKVGREETVTLALDVLGESRVRYYVFSALTSSEHLFDLWLYTPGTLPEWLLDPAYRLGPGATAYHRRGA